MAADDIPPTGRLEDFGPNVGLVEEIYRQWLEDPASVAESWQDFFADYTPRLPSGGGNGAPATAAPKPAPERSAPVEAATPAPAAPTPSEAHKAEPHKEAPHKEAPQKEAPRRTNRRRRSGRHRCGAPAL